MTKRNAKWRRLGTIGFRDECVISEMSDYEVRSQIDLARSNAQDYIDNTARFADFLTNTGKNKQAAVLLDEVHEASPDAVAKAIYPAFGSLLIEGVRREMNPRDSVRLESTGSLGMGTRSPTVQLNTSYGGTTYAPVTTYNGDLTSMTADYLTNTISTASLDVSQITFYDNGNAVSFEDYLKQQIKKVQEDKDA